MTTIEDTEKPAKLTDATRYDFMGETFELDPKIGYELSARYREAAVALHAAKARAFEVEEEIKCVMQGYEHITVHGERLFSWVWKLKTTFNKTKLRQDHPEIHDAYVVKTENGTRAFSAPGVSGVE